MTRSGLMSVKAFSEFTTISKSSIYRLIKNSFFPPGVIFAVGPSRYRIDAAKAIEFMGREQQRKAVIREENRKVHRMRRSSYAS